MSAIPRPGMRSTKAFAIAIVIVLLLLAWATVRSSVFGVREILVAGQSALRRVDVVRLAGVERGDNLVLDVSSEDVRDRLEASPWVAEAAVERRLPSTLVLTVRERTVAGWIDDPGGVAIVSADGTVLQRSGRRPPRLPVLGTTDEALAAGTMVPGMTAVLQVAGSFPGRLRHGVAEVEEAGSEIVLRLRGGGRVLYGPPSSLGPKNAAVLAMLGWAEERGITIAYIDVRAPDAPVLRAAGRG